MKVAPLALLACFYSLSTLAQSLSFDHHVLFIKTKHANALPRHDLIHETKHLFGNVHQLKTSDAILLENDLLQNEDVEWVDKSFYTTGGLHEEVTPVTSAPKSATAAFGINDSQAKRLWAFRDASLNGISFERAYANMPAWQPQKVIVAVLDTGVDYRHPDLKNVMWINKDEIPNNGIDDDNNGYVDDVYGISPLTNSSNPMSSHSHGTHVAGTIAAEQNNGKGIAGVSSQALIMAIRTAPDKGNETDKDVVESMLYAAKNGARILNCSFGKTRQGKIVEETIQHIGDEYGALVVAASGNDSRGKGKWHDIDRRGHYPSSFKNENMLVVTATNAYGKLADFSNIGKLNVDVGAPGDMIVSTIPKNRYGVSSGTSMATPIVAGIAAQVLAYYPSLTPVELKAIIMNSVTPEAQLKDQTVTGGRVDLARAMEYAQRHYSGR